LNTLLPLILSPHLHWKVRSPERNLYLTFDDGPVPGLTKEILSILNEHNVKATFFMVGHNIEKYPDVFHEVSDGGHAIGNHTFRHLNGWKTNTRDYIADIRECSRRIPGKLFRPPYGRITRRQARLLKDDFKIVMWSALTKDYDRNVSKEKCLERAKRGAQPGSIVVFHDNEKARDNVLYALPRFIDYGLKNGYTFRVLDETIL
jgi:peptidoglycan/xylan/chitin deacetylase (PgdA/CDA1 family)